MISRRTLLTYLSAAPLTLTGLGSVAAWAASGPQWGRTLVLVELSGGNDGLNTVIPYRDPLYAKMRPKLAVNAEKVLQLDETLGLHPSMAPLMPLWEERQVAVALGVGYPDPNLSHFRSIDIWDTGSDSNTYLEQGWIAEAFSRDRPPENAAAEGVVLGRGGYGPLYGPDMRAISLHKRKLPKIGDPSKPMTDASAVNPALAHIIDTQQNLTEAAHAILARRNAAANLRSDFPVSDLGQQLETAARLILSDTRVPVFKASLGGFDTHSNQAGKHARLLTQLAEAIAAFSTSMKRHGRWDDVLVMTYAEFGRRPSQNASGGTDHGTSAPHFLTGGRVRGGLYGEQPPLDSLNGKNLAHRLHFRQLYATVSREWWSTSSDFIGEKPLGCIV